MSRLTTMRRHDMIKPKFYIASLCTRWHVYPQQQPAVAVAHDHHGFWALTLDGEWYKAPVSYVLQREITEAEALVFHAASQMPVADAIAELESAGADLDVWSETIFVNGSASNTNALALSVSCGAVQSADVWAAVHKVIAC